MMSASQQGPARVKPDVWGPHVSDTGANPALTRALTHYGAHCQWLWGVFRASLVLIRRATSTSSEFGRRRPKLRRELAGVALRAVLGQAKGTRGFPLLARIQRKHAGGAGWPELAGVEAAAAAGARVWAERG